MKPKRPRDLNQSAFALVRAATGEAGPEEAPRPLPPVDPAKNPAAVALGRLGGQKGGKARAANMTPDERAASARKAAAARWKGNASAK